MSWLEKIGLVERDAAETPLAVEELPTEPEILVDAEIASTDNIVDEIYSQNELSDKSNSIYTVQALIATLPAEMTTAKKQAPLPAFSLCPARPFPHCWKMQKSVWKF